MALLCLCVMQTFLVFTLKVVYGKLVAVALNVLHVCQAGFFSLFNAGPVSCTVTVD